MSGEKSEKVLKSRRTILTTCQYRTPVNKGDKRLAGSHLCAICGTPLTKVDLVTGKAEATKNFWKCYFSDLLTLDICKRADECQRNYLRKHPEENGGGNNGKT